MSDPDTLSELLDATGLTCPLPVLRARKALASIPPGGLLTVLATDPASVRDFPRFCAATGHDLLTSTHADGVFCFVIRRAGPPQESIADVTPTR